MSARALLAVALAMLAFGCGRVGLKLAEWDALPLPVDAGATPDAAAAPDAAMQPSLDASQPVLDASPSMDAATGGGLPVDAGTDASQMMDASTDAGVDAAIDASTPCSGERLFGVCWYLAPMNTNCNSSCSSHGGYDRNSSFHVGTTEEGGSREDCSVILGALRSPANVTAGVRSDGYGFGCHIWEDGTYWWLDDPRFDPRVSVPGNANLRMACGCLR